MSLLWLCCENCNCTPTTVSIHQHQSVLWLYFTYFNSVMFIYLCSIYVYLIYIFLYQVYSCSQKVTCTHHGHAWSGILGPLTISLNCSLIRVKWQRTSIMTLKTGVGCCKSQLSFKVLILAHDLFPLSMPA